MLRCPRYAWMNRSRVGPGRSQLTPPITHRILNLIDQMVKRAPTDPMPVICYLQRHSIRPGWDTSVVGNKPRRAEFSICNYVVGNIDSKPAVRGTERSWINGSTILWPESNANRYRRRYPSPRIGFFYRYYWCTRSSSGMSRFIMRGGALPFELFPGHQFPSCRGTDACAKYTTCREQTRYQGPSAH